MIFEKLKEMLFLNYCEVEKKLKNEVKIHQLENKVLDDEFLNVLSSAIKNY